MEEIHLPSYLIDELEELRNYRYKYANNNTLIAYDHEHIKIVSDIQRILENSEAPYQSFHKE